MSPVAVVLVLYFGTLAAYAQMYTVPCPITQAVSQPLATPNSPQHQNYNPYPMKIIVSYPQNNAGHSQPCTSPQHSDKINPMADLGSLAGILKLPGALADKLLTGEISLN